MSFQLDGFTVHGYHGDTVLSAAIASGFECVGTYAGRQIALTDRFAPPVAPASLSDDPRHILPMNRVQAVDGQSLVCVGESIAPAARARRSISQLLQLRPYSLDLELKASQSMTGPWLNQTPVATVSSDLLVVGGGLAGMSAAACAARSGSRVCLVEQKPYLGGTAALFGSVESEEPPQQSIARLSAEIRDLGVEIYTASEAFSLLDTRALVHQVRQMDGLSEGRVVAFTAPKIILATGAMERLPVMPGNRLPGVCGSNEAFYLADAFGVWPGDDAAFSTTANQAYRVAMLAAGAGVSVPRIVDARIDPRSRFLEFCKAYGIRMSHGVFPLEVRQSQKGHHTLQVEVGVRLGEYAKDAEPITTRRLVCSGGWQPDLTLWHMAGLSSTWQAQHNRFVATERRADLALAGCAAGYFSTSACLQSGEQAVAHLFGRKTDEVSETVIGEHWETEDGPSLIAEAGHASSPTTFLDHGPSLVTRPRLAAESFGEHIRQLGRTDTWRFADQPRTLSIVDIAAAVQLGIIPKAEAGAVARERAVNAIDIVAVAKSAGSMTVTGGKERSRAPTFLNHRFGSGARHWEIEALEARWLEPGSLIYPNADINDPLRAIGVVVDSLDDGPGRAFALLEADRGSAGLALTLRHFGRAVPIRVLRPRVQP
ncbi:hypothetical protein GCM10007989_25990 [Devosia pacifica]|uniref:FAD-dependent oxidoreductase n=1 Tax=Devosia pacifica TaxID=1335967 RepID=A0A918SAF7_9HYPH|nr:FAD-binding protein [Devosia pacifica]GHA29221.1 hypothetical protein GCM10007989_25990 [Devosia pacifica]